MQSFGVE